jgi:pSer/pThr/pTyr-binding forkhead associated (FHA) protein
MVQLRILSGKLAGDIQIVRQFPFCIGRSGGNDLCFDEPGVWDKHLTLGFEKKEGFTLETAPDALATVNGQSQNSTRLRNGDIISFGSAKIQFWLAPAQLRGLRAREMFIWALLVIVTAVQFALICRLVK